jgi:hypothetical protein
MKKNKKNWGATKNNELEETFKQSNEVVHSDIPEK